MKFCTYSGNKVDALRTTAEKNAFIFGDDVTDILDASITKAAWLKNISDARCTAYAKTGTAIACTKVSGVISRKRYLAITARPELQGMANASYPYSNGITAATAMDSTDMFRKVASVSDEQATGAFAPNSASIFRNAQTPEYFNQRHYASMSACILIPTAATVALNGTAIYVDTTLTGSYSAASNANIGGTTHNYFTQGLYYNMALEVTGQYRYQDRGIAGTVAGTGQKFVASAIGPNNLVFATTGYSFSDTYNSNTYYQYLNQSAYANGAITGTPAPSLPYMATTAEVTDSPATVLTYACLPIVNQYKNFIEFRKLAIGVGKDLVPDKASYLPNETPALTINVTRETFSQVFSM